MSLLLFEFSYRGGACRSLVAAGGLLAVSVVVEKWFKSNNGFGFVGSAKESTPRHWGAKAASLVHHVVVGLSSTYYLLKEYGTALYKVATGLDKSAALFLVNKPSPAATILADLSIGYMLYDMLVIDTWETDVALMAAHHLFAITLWPISSNLGYYQSWVLWFLSTEVSSIFLAFRWMLSESDRKRTPAYALNGLIFTGLFISIRVIPIPVWSLSYLLAPSPTEVHPGFTEVPRYATWCGYACLIPLALNAFWGYKVVIGFIKSANEFFSHDENPTK
mmetsp:Transcript_12303/g.15986  ORF Transcript_12303/g.15986 Transcript_12303/m.15986 type:complete len:277 (+) Transcript_12303:201-1031(+)